MFTFSITDAAVQIIDPCGETLAEIPTLVSELPISVSAEPLPGGLRLTYHADADLPMKSELHIPAVTVKPDDLLVIPHFEGFAFRADDPREIVSRHSQMLGGRISMSFWGIVRNGCYILTAVITNIDANFHMPREDGVNRPHIAFLPEKGRWGYDRELRILCGEGGISEMCQAYRKIADEKGLRVPFSEKVKKLPDIDRLVGAADVWLWNDDAMHKLYDADAVYHAPDKEQVDRRLEVADEMKALGMDKVLWSIFDENIERREVGHAKSLGWITTYYDIYTDVIPHDILDLIPDTRRERCKPRIDCWPDGILIDSAGNKASAWQLKGKDGIFHNQNRVCDIAMYECASKVAPEHCRKYGLDGRFIDVTAGSATECYSDDHPTTRRDSIEYKNRLFDMLHENGMFTGTEVGCEDVASTLDYNEGLLSPTLLRMPDAGRRMTHIYRGDQIEPQIKDFMLNPELRVPLWELVYHGCVQSYWYWGDSANCMPELIWLRDMFCCLWGLPEIYSFRVSDWKQLKNDIIASYQRTAPTAKAVGYAAMERFDYLDDSRLIQRSEFSNGVSVVANFSDSDYNYRGVCVKAHSAKTFSCNK